MPAERDVTRGARSEPAARRLGNSGTWHGIGPINFSFIGQIKSFLKANSGTRARQSISRAIKAGVLHRIRPFEVIGESVIVDDRSGSEFLKQFRVIILIIRTFRANAVNMMLNIFYRENWRF